MGYEPNMITAPLPLVTGKRKHKTVSADFDTQARRSLFAMRITRHT